MRSSKFTESLNKLGLFTGGAVGYHLVDVLLSEYVTNRGASKRDDERAQAVVEANKEAKTFYDYASEQFRMLHEASQAKSNNNINSPIISKEEVINSLNSIKSHSNSVMSRLSELKIPNWENSDAYENLINIQKEVDTLTNILLDSNITNQYIPHISKLYEYLDSISLFQEMALFHIIIFIVLLLTVFNILSVLFGNEIIRYFDLEARFPKLGFFFKLRSSLQKYYLVWNVFILFFVCIASIGLNLLIFVVK